VSAKKGRTKIVLFEVSEFGSGGLVFNQPSPVRLKDLAIERFQAFYDNTLMMGRGLDDDDVEQSRVAIGDIGPWFWLHNVENLSGSTRLAGAKDILYMGGNIEEATELIKNGQAYPSQFKFFHKYTKWEGTALDEALRDGSVLLEGPASASEVLKSYSFNF
jgi:hypothetical protein